MVHGDLGSISSGPRVTRNPGPQRTGGKGHPVQPRPAAVRPGHLGGVLPERVEDLKGHGGTRHGAGRPTESPEGKRVYLNCKVLPSTLTKITC